MVSTRKRAADTPTSEAVQEVPSGRRAKKTKAEPKAKASKDDPIVIADDNEEAVAAAADDDNDAADAVDDTVDEWGIGDMDLVAIKELLDDRDLSKKGDKKVLVKRLVARLHKEEDPNYKPKPKGRHCKWCGALMQKRRSLRGQFFGCSTWPQCQYTTSLSGYAKPQREHLKGIPGTMYGRDSRYYERMYG